MSTLAAQQSTFHALSIKNDSRDENYQDIFEGFIRESPELNLINDLPTPDDDLDQKPLIHSTAFGHPHMQLPLLQHHHRLPVHPPPLSILKPHVLQQPSTTPTSSGGISPTLTWSGDPSPIDNTNSPTLNDSADIDGEEWNPPSSSPTAQLFAAPAAKTSSSSRRNSAGSARGRELDGDGIISRASSHSHSRSRSSKRSASSSTSADGGDELTMSNLSIQNGTTSLSALMSGPPSPQASVAGASAHTPKPSAPARKKTRTNSSSRSSISSIDALISEAMGANATPAAGRLVPTGHRRNITSASLVPLDAPTQIRNYLTPSSTSKKEIPSAFVARRNKLKAKEASVTKTSPPGPSTAGRKRTREDAGVDEVDQLQDDDTPMSNNNAAASPSTTPSSPTTNPAPVTAELASESSSLLSAIEAKRRQNTLAARRSRQRKLDYVRNLEELVAALTRERDSWKARAEGAEKILGYRPDEDEMDEA